MVGGYGVPLTCSRCGRNLQPGEICWCSRRNKEEDITLMCCSLHFDANCAKCKKGFDECQCKPNICKTEGENGYCSLHGHFSEPVCPYCIRGY